MNLTGDRPTPTGPAAAAAPGEPVPGQEDPRVARALEEYLAAVETEGEPDRDEFLRRYPAIAQPLAECLDGLEFVNAAAPQLRQSLPSQSINAGLAAEDFYGGTPLGDFRIVREIGRGGMGIVYEAVQISLNRRVALKILPFAAAMDARQLQRFKNEAQATAHLHHTNIVAVHAVGCERGVHYYAMQYIEGQTLAALIRELRQLAGLEADDHAGSAATPTGLAGDLLSGQWAPAKPKRGDVLRLRGGDQPTGPCPAVPPSHHAVSSPPDDATTPVGTLSTEHSSNSPAFYRAVAHLGVQAAEALEHAHTKEIIHRDIKPANLLVDTSGNLWITDFGLARMLSEAGLTMTGDLVGTLRYMSPEQALAKRVAVDHRSDIYSLGVTLYELLTLRPACDGKDRQEVLQQIAFEEPRPPRRVTKAVPVELDTIVRKAIDKDPAKRYATAQELADDLRRFLDDKPIRARKPTLWDWTRKWARRHPGVVATGIAGLIIAVGILSVSTFLILAEYQRTMAANRETVTALYHSKVREAETVRQARAQGYRSEVWRLLQEARALDTPDRDTTRLRQEAVACMGDFVGFEPRIWDFSADINLMALDGKGVRLALGLSDGSLVLRDLGTGAELDCLQLERPVTALAFAPDGRWLVSLDGKGTTLVWEVKADGKLVWARTIAPEPVVAGLIPSAILPFFVPHLAFPTIKAIAITPDGTQLGACVDAPYSPTTIALWNLADGTRSGRSFSEQRLERYIRMAFSPDGKFLAASYRRSHLEGIFLPSIGREASSFGVLVWRLDTGRLEQDLSSDLRNIGFVTFSPDGKLLACSGFWGVTLYDTATFGSHRSLLGEATTSVAFTADSRLAACAGSCLGRVQLWNHATNHVVAVLQHLNEPRDFAHFSVVYSRDHNALVAASRRAVRTWFLAGRGEKLNLPAPATDILSIAFSPDGNLLASPGPNNTIRICNATTGQVSKILTDVGNGVLQTLAFSPDGRMLATADWTGTIRIYDVESGAKLIEPTDRRLGRGIFALAFSPNGQYFAVCGADGGGVTLWGIKPRDRNRGPDASLEMEVIARPCVGHSVWSLAFSPDSELLAWVKSDGYHSSNNMVHIWDVVNSREHPFTPRRLAENLQSIAFHPVTKHLIFVADTDAVETWDVKTGKRTSSLNGRICQEQDGIPSCAAGTIALSSDGAWLASSHGRFVSIWDMASGRLLLKLPEEENCVMSLAWRPNQGLLTVATFDGGIAIWDVPKIEAQLDEIGLGWETGPTQQSTIQAADTPVSPLPSPRPVSSRFVAGPQ